jgi:hypothetical protein
MAYKYLGPSDVFWWNDKPYARGADIPISKDMAEHHTRQGHRFEEFSGDELPEQDPEPVTVQPVDDSGQVLHDAKVIEAKDAQKPDSASPQASGATRTTESDKRP